VTFEGLEFLYIFLQTPKTVRVTVHAMFKNSRGTSYGNSSNHRERFNGIHFDLAKFNLGRGTIKDKRIVLQEALRGITADKKIVQHCKEVVRKCIRN
jgi:hypothetical protein